MRSKTIVTVVKAYSSAVGAGAFVSEIFGDEADELRKTWRRRRRVRRNNRHDLEEWDGSTALQLSMAAVCRVQQTLHFTVVDVLGYLRRDPCMRRL